jgi:hypothetical protein
MIAAPAPVPFDSMDLTDVMSDRLRDLEQLLAKAREWAVLVGVKVFCPCASCELVRAVMGVGASIPEITEVSHG